MKFTKNNEFNSLEISFEEKPSEKVREILKANHFRWHSVKKCGMDIKHKKRLKKL